MIRAVVIDDEESAVHVLQLLLEKHVPEITDLASATDAAEGIRLIETIKPDLVFLDIEMPLLSGFDVIDKFPEGTFEVIFTTAYNQYAIKAIRFSALDYLLKPVNAEELRAAVLRFIAKRDIKQDHEATYSNLLHNLRSEKTKDYRLAIATTEGTYFFKTDEIIRCEADGNYTRFILHNKKAMITSRTLKEYDELLRDHDFIRVHRAHLVNRKFIASLHNDHELRMKDDSVVEVSRRKWDEVKQVLAS